MEIISYHKGQTVKTAVVKGAKDKDEAIDFALAHAGESRGNLFGWNTHQNLGEDLWRIEMFTD